ncbi:MAG: D-alanyl-D-alanine carboxypeptidase/D-alanyl-D-alanine-endopeptidase [Methylophilus sp.]
MSHHTNNQLSKDSTPFANAFSLEKIVADMNKRATAGVTVKSLTTGKVLYQKDANQLYSPASNMKIITAFAALKFLGPNFVYQTQLMTDAANPNPANGVLEGNLYLKYNGDPTLQLQDINALFKSLKSRGVNAIAGNLYVDTSRYDNNGISPGTDPSDRGYCYGAPVTSAIINHNCVSFKLCPTKIGAPARIAFPYDVSFSIVNSVMTRSGKNCRLSLSNGANSLTINGCVSSQRGPVAITIPVPSNSGYGEKAAVKLLASNGINVQGKTYPTRSTGLNILLSHNSDPLSALVLEMMKKSDNLIANTLFKSVGAKYNQVPATWKNSGDAVRAVLQKSGVDTAGMVIIDGSGLSRDNRVTPDQLLQVLSAAYRDSSIADVYLQALPVGGKSGTLKRRLSTKDIIGKVKAKTGSMHGVSSLSGYVETQSGEMLAFSIIVNDFSGGLYPYRALEDKLCRVLRAVY